MTVLTLTLNPAIDKTLSLPAFNVGSLNRLTEQPREDLGGKGINVAKVLNQLKLPVTTSGYIAGQTGNKMVSKLEEMDIKTNFVKVEGNVRTNLKIVDQQTNETTEINEPGFDITSEDETNLMTALKTLLNEKEYMVLGGSLPSGSDVTIYKQLIEQANQFGVKTILDASGEALKQGIQAKPYAIKPNIHELEQLLGEDLKTPQEVAEACLSLIDQYQIELVVASLGKDGAIFATKEQCLHSTPFEIEAKSSVGAGDSMVGAMIYSRLNQFNLEKLAKWSTSAGTITASKSGTDVCCLEEIEQSYEKVSLKTLILEED